MIEFKDKITFEMSGSPKFQGWGYKQDFVNFMIKHGFTHTTLTKNTDLLVVDDDSSNTGKIVKARKYNIPIVTYSELAKDKTKLYTKLTRKNRMFHIMKLMGEL